MLYKRFKTDSLRSHSNIKDALHAASVLNVKHRQCSCALLFVKNIDIFTAK